MKSFNKIALAIVFMAFVSLLSNCGTSSGYTSDVQYSNPSWAPEYASGVRYYYMPDIEVYYDLSDQDFVYLDNGQWYFTHSLPSMYSDYDLYNGYVVALNYNIYQPWMHHQNYVSHYPRYYYRNVYRDDERARIRGFNENERKPIYHRGEVKPRINEIHREERIEKKPEYSREPQKPNYYGKEIGQPVKVKRNMREIKAPVQRESNVQHNNQEKRVNKPDNNRETKRIEKPR